MEAGVLAATEHAARNPIDVLQAPHRMISVSGYRRP